MYSTRKWTLYLRYIVGNSKPRCRQCISWSSKSMVPNGMSTSLGVCDGSFGGYANDNRPGRNWEGGGRSRLVWCSGRRTWEGARISPSYPSLNITTGRQNVFVPRLTSCGPDNHNQLFYDHDYIMAWGRGAAWISNAFLIARAHMHFL